MAVVAAAAAGIDRFISSSLPSTLSPRLCFVALKQRLSSHDGGSNIRSGTESTTTLDDYMVVHHIVPRAVFRCPFPHSRSQLLDVLKLNSTGAEVWQRFGARRGGSSGEGGGRGLNTACRLLVAHVTQAVK